MKVFRFILALYILLMALYPCSDSKTCLDEQKAGIAVATQTNHEHGSAEQDLCTPFCICSCCAAHVQIKDTHGMSGKRQSHNTLISTLYQERIVFRSNDSIFQPPKS